MRVATVAKDAALSAIIVAGVLGAGLVGVVAVAAAGKKIAGVLLGLAAIVGVSYITRNPRLVCLYGFMATMSLNLSRKLTGFSDRGGGASGIQLDASDPFWIGLAVCMVWELFTRRRHAIRIPKVVWIWAAIMALGSITVIFGIFQRVAAYEVIRMGKMAVIFIVLVNELQRPKQFIHATAGLALGVALQAGVAVAQYARGGNLGLEILGETAEATTQQLAESSVVGQEIWRVSGLLLHPNLLGVFLAVVIPVCLAMFLAPIGRLLRLFFLTTAAFATVALIATFSRSSWVSFAGAMAIFGGLTLAHKQMWRRALMPTVAASICLGVVLVAFSGPILTRLFGSKIDATDARERFKEEAARLIAERPVFGWGINSYVDVVLPFSDFSRKAYGGWVPPVHNIYYLWTADMGFVGLLLHLWVVGFLLWVGISNLRIRHPMMYTINAACLSAIVGFLIDGNFSFSLRVDQIQRTFWTLAAIMCAVRYWRLTGGAAEAMTEPDGSGLLPEARGLFRASGATR